MKIAWFFVLCVAFLTGQGVFAKENDQGGLSGPEQMQGGYRASEAREMVILSCDLNASGITGESCPAVEHWELLKDGNDAENGGLGPFKNRWKLWRNKNAERTYAVAIRGTIENPVSIIQDVLATTLKAHNVAIPTSDPEKALYFKLADDDHADVHMGFAYGLAEILFYKEHGEAKGLLTALQDLPDDSQIFITGHSQGAAIATLLHAFVFHAVKGCTAIEENCVNDRFGLKGKSFGLKSYVFAQPKPGNWQFAMDFANAVGNSGYAYTVDNIKDWVPQLPLSVQLLDETLDEVLANSNPAAKAPQNIVGGVVKDIRRGIAAHTAKLTAAIIGKQNHLDPAYFSAAIGGMKQASSVWYKPWTWFNDPEPMGAGSSINYAPAGVVLAVRPGPSDIAPPGDELWEHHTLRYVRMVDALGQPLK